MSSARDGTKPGVKKPEPPLGDEGGHSDKHATQVKQKSQDLHEIGDSDDPTRLRKDIKLQGLGKQIVSNLYMLVRNVKIHAPDNQVFLKPIDQLRESMNSVIATDRQLDLHAVATTIYLNNTALKFDFAALENVQYLTRELEHRDIGGFSTK